MIKLGLLSVRRVQPTRPYYQFWYDGALNVDEISPSIVQGSRIRIREIRSVLLCPLILVRDNFDLFLGLLLHTGQVVVVIRSWLTVILLKHLHPLCAVVILLGEFFLALTVVVRIDVESMLICGGFLLGRSRKSSVS